jgi:hypothetical protein
LINYRCSVEYIDRISYESRKREWEKARQSDLPSGLIKSIEEDLQGSGKKYELQDVLADATGRIKINNRTGDYDNAGHRHPAKRLDLAWDGELAVRHSNYLEGDYPGGAVIAAKKQRNYSLMRRPLRIFGGRFLEALDKASSAGKNIEFEQNKADGTWQISFEADDPAFHIKDCVWKCTVDPSKNFSVTSGERSQKQGDSSRFSVDYKEIEDGIWFPVNGKLEGFYPDGVNEFVSNVKITNIVINDPNVGKNSFHFDIPRGAHVRDTIGGIAYIVGDPSSMRRLGEPLGVTNAIVHDAVKNAEVIFVPDIKMALKEDSPFVLVLKTGKLVSVDRARGTSDVLKRLKGAGIGDLLWDDGLVLFEGVRMKPVTGANRGLIELVEMENGKLYKFQNDIGLPCTLILIDRAETSYCLTISEISKRGISLTCEIVRDK